MPLFDKKTLLSTLRPASVEPKPVPPTKTVGAPATPVFGGYIQEFETERELFGVTKYKTYSDILANVTIVATGCRFFLNLVSKSKWTVEPADNSPTAKEYADRLENIMDDMTTPWHRIVRRGAMYRFYGFSAQEWTAKRRNDGTFGILDVEPRAQVTIVQWDTDINGRVLGIVQLSPQDGEYIYIPRSKIIYLVDDSLNDSPEGMGIFRHIVKAGQTLRYFEKLEGFGFETDLRGIPLARVPESELEDLVGRGELSKMDRDGIIQPIVDFMNNHNKSNTTGMIMDSSTYLSTGENQTPSNQKKWDLELLKGSSNSLPEVAKSIERLNFEIARVMGVEGLLLGGSGSGGNRALGEVFAQNLALVVDSTLDEIREVFQKDYIGTIWRLNKWPEDMMPTYSTESTEAKDVERITRSLADMASAGALISPGDPAINSVRDLLGIPDEPDNLHMDVDAAIGNDDLEGNTDRVNEETENLDALENGEPE